MARKTQKYKSHVTDKEIIKYFDLIINWIEKNQGKTIIFSILLFLITFMLIPYILTQSSIGFKLDKSSAQIGNAIGGIVGPIVALIAAILTFFAFWVQYKANVQQRMDIAQQRKDFKQQQKEIETQKIERQKDRFENRFYEMIKLHKENVNEISLSNINQNRPEIKGRNAI